MAGRGEYLWGQGGEQLTHQDHPEIVGHLLSVGIGDEEMGGEAVVEVGGDALVGVLRGEGGARCGGGVLVCGGGGRGEGGAGSGDAAG